MRTLTYHLSSYCNGKLLAYDFCRNTNELKHTFMDAYKFYVGRKPTGRTVANFLCGENAIAHDKSLEYVFVSTCDNP